MAQLEFEKPALYVLDFIHPEAIPRAQELFRIILPSDPEHANWRRNARYLLVRASTLTANDIASCSVLRIIGKQGVGVDKINASACAERGIQICNTPGVSARAVAELALALAMSMARDLTSIVVRQASGQTVPKADCTGLVLHKRTIGIIGMGNIGKATAKIFHGAFESPVLAYGRSSTPSTSWSDVPHTRAESIEQVLREADIVTIHIPLTDDTRNLIAYKELSMMKPDAILVNTARGGIVHERDLERALAEGLIWGAGLDCHELEPPVADKYKGLWSHRVVSTPHVGGNTAQTLRDVSIAAVENIYKRAMYIEQGQ